MAKGEKNGASVSISRSPVGATSLARLARPLELQCLSRLSARCISQSQSPPCRVREARPDPLTPRRPGTAGTALPGCLPLRLIGSLPSPSPLLPVLVVPACIPLETPIFVTQPPPPPPSRLHPPLRRKPQPPLPFRPCTPGVFCSTIRERDVASSGRAGRAGQAPASEASAAAALPWWGPQPLISSSAHPDGTSLPTSREIFCRGMCEKALSSCQGIRAPPPPLPQVRHFKITLALVPTPARSFTQERETNCH